VTPFDVSKRKTMSDGEGLPTANKEERKVISMSLRFFHRNAITFNKNN